MEYVLGIDVGTNGTKAALFDPAGNLVDSEFAGYDLRYPHPGWVEQNAEDWWDAVVRTTRLLVERNECYSTLSAMALSTQGGSLVMLDDMFRPIAPAVSWLDTRSKKTRAELLARVSALDIYQRTGWTMTDGLSFPVCNWLAHKEPETLRRAAYVGSTADFLHQRLAGRFAVDPTNLALTEFLDLSATDVWLEAMETVGLRRSQFSEIVPPGTVIGTLKPDAARLMGITSVVRVVTGGHDQYCASLGAGAIHPGECVLSTGTAWAILATTDRLYFNHESVAANGFSGAVYPGHHVLPGLFGLMTSVPFGGNSLAWFRQTFQPHRSFEELDEMTVTTEAGSLGLRYVPVSASKTGRGAFVGVDGVHTVPDFVRAIYEGVAMANRSRIDLIRKTGPDVERLIMIGGGASSRTWPQIVADVSGLPVIAPAVQEAACTGAAILAGLATGFFSTPQDAIVRTQNSDRQIEPIEKNAERYDQAFQSYRQVAEFV